MIIASYVLIRLFKFEIQKINVIKFCVHLRPVFSCRVTYNYVIVLIIRLFDFSNKEKGIVNFKGNMLFTHFSEIGSPDRGDMELTISEMPPQQNAS